MLEPLNYIFQFYLCNHLALPLKKDIGKEYVHHPIHQGTSIVLFLTQTIQQLIQH
jgi:hypothetical protein